MTDILPPVTSTAATRHYVCVTCERARDMRDDESLGRWGCITTLGAKGRTWWFCSRRCRVKWGRGMDAAGTNGGSIRLVPR